MTLLPEHTAQFIADESIRVVGTDHECEGALFHSPKPIVTYGIPSREGGIWLCGTCSDKLEILLRLLRESNGAVPWPVRREFGNALRAAALSLYREPNDE